MNAAEAIEKGGFCPRSTPIDTIMRAPYGLHATVAEAMDAEEDDGEDEYAFDVV